MWYQFTSCKPIEKLFSSVLCPAKLRSCSSFHSIAKKKNCCFTLSVDLFVLKHTHTLEMAAVSISNNFHKFIVCNAPECNSIK